MTCRKQKNKQARARKLQKDGAKRNKALAEQRTAWRAKWSKSRVHKKVGSGLFATFQRWIGGHW